VTTASQAGSLTSVLGVLPAQLRAQLVDAFNEIAKNYRERRWEPAELNAGKLCEVAYSILKGHVDGSYPKHASKPKNLVDACKALESATTAPRSVRIQIPRMIVALYEIRNNRNVGHVGGDVDPNHMDALCVLQMSKWIVAELVRVLHNVDVDDAAELVEALVERETPLIWDVNGVRRVLDTSLSMRDKTLLLLHASDGPLAERDLVRWIEHTNASVYRRDVLRKAHKARFIEYDQACGTVTVSPRGIELVENEILPQLVRKSP
jgi:hypothetical protein